MGAEAYAPYERPHLSKGFLLGTVPIDRIGLRPAKQYAELGVELALGSRVVELDLQRRSVRLENGRALGWDRLCIATGSSARRLPGHEQALYLRELSDAQRLKEMLDLGSGLTLIGAGFIGCEVAAAARHRGCAVSMYEALGQPLERVLGTDLGAYVAAVHRQYGVELRVSVAQLPELEPPLIAGVGSQPRTELAEAAGLEVEEGIAVDDQGRTSVPDVFAAGDVTRFWHPLYETRIRVEHFQTAQRQAFAVGRAMAGSGAPFAEVPWFWSDQYDLNLQYAGAGLEWDSTVTRGSFGRPPFSVFYLRHGHPVAVAGINDHHTVSRARRLMESRAKVSPDELADPAFDLRRARS